MENGQSEFHRWVIERVAEYCRCNPVEIDPNENFTHYGIDSVQALALVGDIEDRLGHPIVTTAIWDHPNVNELVDFVQSLSAVDTDTSINHEAGV